MDAAALASAASIRLLPPQPSKRRRPRPLCPQSASATSRSLSSTKTSSLISIPGVRAVEPPRDGGGKRLNSETDSSCSQRADPGRWGYPISVRTLDRDISELRAAFRHLSQAQIGDCLVANWDGNALQPCLETTRLELTALSENARQSRARSLRSCKGGSLSLCRAKAVRLPTSRSVVSSPSSTGTADTTSPTSPPRAFKTRASAATHIPESSMRPCGKRGTCHTGNTRSTLSDFKPSSHGTSVVEARFPIHRARGSAKGAFLALL